MKKLYFKLCRVIGYTIIMEYKYNIETFKPDKKYSSISLYKYLEKYKGSNSIGLKKLYTIEIPNMIPV